MFSLSYLFVYSPFSVLAMETDSFPVESYVSKAESNVKKGEFFKALENYQAAIDKGINSPDIKQQMSVLYYHLGFLDKAIKATEEALDDAPENDYLHHNLGILYFVKNNLDKAREHFVKALKINPGSANSHYYLAHVFWQQGLPEIASMFAHSAQQLDHSASDISKLLDMETQSSTVTVWLGDNSKIYLRQIFLKNRKRSEEVMGLLSEGVLFEDIARLESDSLNGGYSGGYSHGDLKPEVVFALSNREIPSLPIVIESEQGFTIVQKIAPIDWEKIISMYDFQYGLQESTPVGSMDIQKDLPYSIQIGAFREYEYAQDEIEKINALGYEGYMVKKLKVDRPLYMVFAGNYPDSLSAEKVLSVLKDKGFDSFIVKRKASL